MLRSVVAMAIKIRLIIKTKWGGGKENYTNVLKLKSVEEFPKC